MKAIRGDGGGVIAGFLLLVVVGAVAVGGYLGYQYWQDNQDTTPPPAAVPQGSEQLSGNGVTVVIPRGWSETSVRENQLRRAYEAVVAAKPNAADKSGLDQVQVDPDAYAFAAVEDQGGKNAESLQAVTLANAETDLTSARSASTVLLKRLGAAKIRWNDPQLDAADALQVDYEQRFGPVTVYQRQYLVIGDKSLATLTFTSLRPIGDKNAGDIANTMRVD